MQYAKLIHEYLDTGLGETQETALFSAIADNSEVRSEFNQQVRLNSIASKDMQTIIPPMDVTQNIFKTLGFASPAMEVPKAIIKSPSNWKRITSYIATLAVGASISFLFISDYNESNSLTTNFKNSNNNIALVNKIDKNKSDLNLVDSHKTMTSPNLAVNSGDRNSNSSNNILNKTINKNANNLNTNTSNSQNNKSSNYNSSFSLNSDFNTNAGFDSNFDSDNNGSFLSDLVDGVSDLISTLSLGAGSDANSSNNSSNNSANSINTNSNSLITSLLQNSNSNNLSSDNQEIDTDWTVQLRFLSSQSFPKVELSNSDGAFSNFSLGLLYQLEYDLSVGAEIGMERFGQEFYRTFVDSRQLQIQNPQLFHYGANIKWMPSELFANKFINPYVQFGMGGTSIGPIARGQIGVYLRPDVRFSLLLGFELTRLWYQAESVNYNTDKKGFSLGINYNF